MIARGGFVRAARLAVGGLLALVFLGGMVTRGYAGAATDQLWAAMAVVLAGGVSLVVWATMPEARPARRAPRVFLATLGAITAWAFAALAWLPTGLVESLTPWGKALEAARGSGFAVPEWLPISTAPERTWLAASQWAVAFGFAAGAVFAAEERVVARWLVGLVAGLTVVEGVLGLLAFGLGGAPRASGVLYNPNHHAAAVVMGFPLVAALGLRLHRPSAGRSAAGRDRERLVALVLTAVLMGWVASFSRASLATGLPVLLLWMAWEARVAARRGRGRLPMRTVGAVPLVVLAVVGAEGWRARSQIEGDLPGRTAIWAATWYGFLEAPLTGLGAGGAEYAINRHTTGIALRSVPIYTHNDWLQFLADQGIVGALLLVAGAGATVGVWWRESGGAAHLAVRRAAALERAAAAGLVAAALHAFFEFHLRIPLVAFEALTLIALLSTGALPTLALRPPESAREQS